MVKSPSRVAIMTQRRRLMPGSIFIMDFLSEFELYSWTESRRALLLRLLRLLARRLLRPGRRRRHGRVSRGTRGGSSGVTTRSSRHSGNLSQAGNALLPSQTLLCGRRSVFQRIPDEFPLHVFLAAPINLE